MQQMLPLGRQSRQKVYPGVSLPAESLSPGIEQPTLRQHTLLSQWIGLPLVLLLLMIGWQMLVMMRGYQPFILPGPAVVVERFIITAQSGLLWEHVTITVHAALGGFLLALVVGMLLGYLLAHLRWMERALAPVLAASQAIPILAVAPLLILWFGTGFSARALIAGTITFFPILISTIVALRGIPHELREMALISGATRWQMLRHIEVPLALPVVFGGIRTGLSLATTGAVVGEFVAGRAGLGALINIARGLFDTPLIFVALVMLASMTLTFYLLAYLLERLLVRWEW